MSENRIKESIATIQLSESQKELGKQQLLEQYSAEQGSAEQKKAKYFPFQIRRWAIAAIFAFILVSVPIYAASHYQLFSMFFHNARDTTEQSVLEELAEASSSQQTSFSTEDYVVTVLSNVYCEEQNMGMVVCSLDIAKDSEKVFAFETVNPNGSANNYYVSANGLVSAGQVYKNADTSLDISGGSTSVNTDISTECYFDGARTEDGAYICGIRYTGTCGASAKLVLVGWLAEESKSTRNIFGSSNLPKASGVSATTYVSEDASKTSILVSPFGMIINGAGSEAGMLPYNAKDEGGIRNDIYINTDTEELKLNEIATPQMTEEQDENNNESYCLTISFATLLQVKDIKSIIYADSNGEKIVFEKSNVN